MGEMETESDRRLKNEVEMMNIKVENMRKMFLDTEIKRLVITEEELKSDKAGEGGDEVREVGKDVHQKLELVNIQVEQMKLSLADFYKQLRDRRDLSRVGGGGGDYQAGDEDGRGSEYHLGDGEGSDQ